MTSKFLIASLSSSAPAVLFNKPFLRHVFVMSLTVVLSGFLRTTSMITAWIGDCFGAVGGATRAVLASGAAVSTSLALRLTPMEDADASLVLARATKKPAIFTRRNSSSNHFWRIASPRASTIRNYNLHHLSLARLTPRPRLLKDATRAPERNPPRACTGSPCLESPTRSGSPSRAPRRETVSYPPRPA